MNRLKRTWDRWIGWLPRWLMQRLTADFPNSSFNGITLVVADQAWFGRAREFFDRTVVAFELAKTHAASAFDALRGDVDTIVLWRRSIGCPYHPFQRAIVVPPSIFELEDPMPYAVWLLRASAMHTPDEARKRADTLLAVLSVEDRTRISAWLNDVAQQEHAVIVRNDASEDDDWRQSCKWNPKT